MHDAIFQSYLDSQKTLGQVSPCKWEQDIDFTFGSLSSEKLDMSYLNTLTLFNDSSAHYDWIKQKLSLQQVSPQSIEIYSPSSYFSNDKPPCIENYQGPLHYAFYHCSLCSYNLANDNRIYSQVSSVRCERSLRNWVFIQSSYHPSMILSLRSYIDYFQSLLELTSSIELHLIYDKGIAVNASLLFMSDHACYGGWNVMLPEYQRRGYGLASLAGRIQRAKSLGFKRYFGLASPNSLSLFETLKLDAVGSLIRYKKISDHKHKQSK